MLWRRGLTSVHWSPLCLRDSVVISLSTYGTLLFLFFAEDSAHALSVFGYFGFPWVIGSLGAWVFPGISPQIG